MLRGAWAKTGTDDGTMPKEAVSLETTSGSGMKNNDLTFAMEKIGVHTIRKQKIPIWLDVCKTPCFETWNELSAFC